MPNRGTSLSAHITVSVHDDGGGCDRRSYAEILPGRWRLVEHIVVKGGEEQRVETADQQLGLDEVVTCASGAVTVIDTNGAMSVDEVLKLLPQDSSVTDRFLELSPTREIPGLPALRHEVSIEGALVVHDGVLLAPLHDADDEVRWIVCDPGKLKRGEVVPRFLRTIVKVTAMSEGGRAVWTAFYKLGWIDDDTAALVGQGFGEDRVVALQARAGLSPVEAILRLLGETGVDDLVEAFQWCVEQGERSLEYAAGDDYVTGDEEEVDDKDPRFSLESPSVDELTITVNLKALAAAPTGGLRSIT